jgi:Ran GTPase-activating protein (RanGAP) involved in mRNA processing and transport
MVTKPPSPGCPMVRVPEVVICDPAELDPLVAWLDRTPSLAEKQAFPRGTALPDGRIDLCKQSIGPLGARRVVDVLRRRDDTGTDTSLLLGTNAIGDEGASAVSDLVREHKLGVIYLGCNKITATGTQALSEALESDDVAHALWLERNPIGPEGARALARMLTANRQLETLDLMNTALGDEGIEHLCEVLGRENTTLRHLYVGGNGIGPRGAQALADMLPRHPGLRSLSLAVNHLGDEGVATLTPAVLASSLEDLSLASNGIGPDSADALGEIMLHWTLQRLELRRAPSTFVLEGRLNAIGDEGCQPIAAALPRVTSLRHLDLAHNGVRSPGAHRLLQGLEPNRSLVRLNLSKGVAKVLRRKIRAILERNAEALGDAPTTPDHIRRIQSVYRVFQQPS